MNMKDQLAYYQSMVDEDSGEIRKLTRSQMARAKGGATAMSCTCQTQGGTTTLVYDNGAIHQYPSGGDYGFGCSDFSRCSQTPQSAGFGMT